MQYILRLERSPGGCDPIYLSIYNRNEQFFDLLMYSRLEKGGYSSALFMLYYIGSYPGTSAWVPGVSGVPQNAVLGP